MRQADILTTSSIKMPPVKRVCLGGRGREWAAESLKLLETMTELKDAKIFLEPMDPLKYPDYYTMVSEPIDLSKIMLKFHGGAYSNLQQFCKDMRDMFDNYKAFFADSESEIFNQVRRLSAWFESETERIQTRWYRLCMNTLTSAPSGSTRAYHPRTGSLEARIQAIEADNQRIIGGMSSFSAPRPTLNLAHIRPRTPVYAIRLSNPTTSSCVVSSSCSSASLYLVSKSSSSCSSTAAIASVPTAVPVVPSGSTTSSVPAAIVAPAGGAPTASTTMLMCPRGASTPLLAAAKMVLIVDVTNVWFGAVRCKPSQPVVISEQGFKLAFKDSDTNVEFTIEASEIVRCAAYFGNARKHTLFVFVVPNCTRRLPASVADRHSLSTLVVIFLPALSQRQIADLVYIFWRISRLSMFGVNGGLLTEIDQKGALSLLSNIKPTILSTVAERMRDIAGAELPSLGLNSTDNGGAGTSSGTGTSFGTGTSSGTGTSPVTQHVAVPVEVSSKAAEYRTLSGRRVKRKSLLGDEPDNNEQQHNKLRIKLTKCHPKILKRRRKNSSPVTQNDLDLDLATTDSIVGTVQSAAAAVCKAEIIDDDYDQHMNTAAAAAAAAGDCAGSDTDVSVTGAADMTEQFTIIEQWETVGNGPTAAARSERHNSDVASNNDNTDDDTERSDNDAASLNNGENDLEIVLPSESEDADVEVDNASLSNGVESQDECQDQDLVMTREKPNLRCPITQQIMQHPMRNKRCGHCYDRQGVEDLINHRGSKARCPVPGCSNETTLTINDLKHEYNLWQYIQTKSAANGSNNNNSNGS